jgi:hypothetical protein
MSGDFLTMLLVLFAILAPLALLVWLAKRALEGLERGKKREYLLGAAGIVALNLGLYLVFSLLQQRPIALADLAVWLPWVVNLVPILILALVRRWVAIGALALLGFLLAWAFLAGVLFFMSCILVGVFGSALGQW